MPGFNDWGSGEVGRPKVDVLKFALALSRERLTLPLGVLGIEQTADHSTVEQRK